MHLIEIDDIRAQPSQRILDLLSDAGRTRVAIDSAIFPSQSDLGGDRHLVAQRTFQRLADDLLGAAKSVDRSSVDQCHATIDCGANGRDRLSLVGTALHPTAHCPGAEPDARSHQTGFDEFNLFHNDLLLLTTEAGGAAVAHWYVLW